ncbi:MutS 5 [Candida viswanathii]|uniref:MutS 5 n=1 Tax=Candida viswanathii TaxID=5486 RepID=A0A367Y077_9ASCO|nr:MutS 5 [Candida viswanathii]
MDNLDREDERSTATQENTSFDVSHETILCLDIKGSLFGATCLDVESHTLEIFEDCQLNNPGVYIESVIDDVKPSSVFASTRVSPGVVSVLEDLKEVYGYRLNIKIVADFTKFDVKRLVDGFEQVEETSSRILSNCALCSPNLKLVMGTINALWLGIAEYVDPSCNAISELVNTIRFTSFKDFLFIDVDLLYALQVLPDSRKSSQSKISSKAQKNSLFELLNNTVTKEGSRMLKDWIRKPLVDYNRIIERQNTVKILGCPENSEIRWNIKKCLKGTKNITTTIKGLQAGKSVWNNWKNLVTFLQNTASLLKHVRNCFGSVDVAPPELLAIFLQPVVVDLIQLQDFILQYVEPVTSEEDGRVRILNGIDDELDNLKIQYNDLDRILQETTRLIADRFPANEQVFNTVYIPQLGFLVSREEDIQLANTDLTFMPNEWQEVFRTSTNMYYKSDEVNLLDQQYGDIYTLINDREIEIIQEVLEKVLESEEAILDVARASIELDCYCSLAELSQLSNYVFPEITDDTLLEIVQGRHPLVETYLSLFVPNDTVLAGDAKIMIVTGANLSGKSVYLNQTGLIVIMAQIGCAIPAESATIGIVDKVLTRILTRESLDKNQSTFAIDVFQLSKCISLCTEKSLVVVDEFGKGSDHVDSTALFGACLTYFESTDNCPRCLFSTHFLDLFKDQVLRKLFESPIFEMVSTEILLEKDKEENVTYLYKVKPGVADKSFGIYCAKVFDKVDTATRNQVPSGEIHSHKIPRN